MKYMHMNSIYPWACGATDLTTTNPSNVDCPACLLLKPANLHGHPLTPFFAAVADEYDRGLAKYGEWSKTLSNEEQLAALKSECLEWEAASLKTIGGRERESQELTHLSNCCGKRWIELMRKEK